MLTVAWEAIERGVASGELWLPELEQAPAPLRAPGASFVTLYTRASHMTGRNDARALRGCIGSLLPCRALLQDVAHNAFYSALRDTRFVPVQQRELGGIELELSILSPLVPLQFHDEADLLRQLVAGVDGLALESEGYHATFLPSVWQQLPGVDQFWRQLKRKAGLAADFWSPQLRCSRYRVLKIAERPD
ncbi:AmmeMemoRadiSam system protein A [Marinobacterium sedimentorum]|uniref:AmmeMemoRadiSam system protein A n=1 Tax=Marinobacterium sedimentorum TaxID=2927804 RepID=UPI0020C62C2D|nr:AmmeMemoRadiSam system protein A [Marinobacterium sedimentorum]MCP8689228.1 AmmeMemoRadiSam system protein A [Marinobacterium sedimentorum]